MTEMIQGDEVGTVLSLLSMHGGNELKDTETTRRIALADLGISSVTFMVIIVELEERLDRPFDSDAFANMATVGDLLHAVGLD